jgi:hypothetical protein
MELDVDGHAEHSSCITAVPMEWLLSMERSTEFFSNIEMVAIREGSSTT